MDCTTALDCIESKSVNSPEKANTRHSFIDIARGIGIILMIIGHSNEPWIINKLIYGFHMPLFFVISGYLWNENKWSVIGLKRLISAKLKSYVFPYFALSFVNYVLYLPVLFTGEVKANWQEVLIDFLFKLKWTLYGHLDGKTHYNALWFLLCLFVSNIYFYILIKIKGRVKRLIVCVLSVAFYTFLVNIKHYVIPISHISYPWHMETAFLGTVFMYIGFIIKRQNLLFNKKTNLFLVIVILLFCMMVFYHNGTVDMNLSKMGKSIVLSCISAACMSYLLLIACSRMPLYNSQLLLLGRNTIIVMGFNGVINLYFGIICKHIPYMNNLECVWWLKSILCIAVSILVIHIWNGLKNQCINWFYKFKRKFVQ